MSFPLDAALVKEWLQNVADTTKRSLVQGIILIPTAGSHMIKAFDSFNALTLNPPYLQVVRDLNGVPDTLYFLSGEDAFVANIEERDLVKNPQLLYVQSGVAYRSKLTFDVAKIPPRATINNATMELTLDRSNSRIGSIAIDTLLANFLTQANGDTTDVATFIGRRLDASKDVYSFVITGMVQKWVNGTANNGLLLRTLTEIVSLDLYTFYSPSVADTTRKPILKVTYTPRPN
jgi:hypothetical protein